MYNFRFVALYTLQYVSYNKLV